MNKNNLSRLFPVLALVSFGTLAHGAVSDITLTNNGYVSTLKPGFTLVEAFNFQGATLSRSGINFLGENMTDGIGGSASLVTLSGGALASADIGSAVDPFFFTEVYNNGGAGLRMTISGLDPAKTYFFETYHGEYRSCCSPAIFSTDSFIDASGTTAIPSYTLGNGLVDNNANDKWTISATFSGVSSFQYNNPNGAGRGSSMMGYQLQSVPEPASAALLLMGGMLAIRRRRQAA